MSVSDHQVDKHYICFSQDHNYMNTIIITKTSKSYPDVTKSCFAIFCNNSIRAGLKNKKKYPHSSEELKDRVAEEVKSKAMRWEENNILGLSDRCAAPSWSLLFVFPLRIKVSCNFTQSEMIKRVSLRSCGLKIFWDTEY